MGGSRSLQWDVRTHDFLWSTMKWCPVENEVPRDIRTSICTGHHLTVLQRDIILQYGHGISSHCTKTTMGHHLTVQLLYPVQIYEPWATGQLKVYTHGGRALHWDVQFPADCAVQWNVKFPMAVRYTEMSNFLLTVPRLCATLRYPISRRLTVRRLCATLRCLMSTGSN